MKRSSAKNHMAVFYYIQGKNSRWPPFFCKCAFRDICVHISILVKEEKNFFKQSYIFTANYCWIKKYLTELWPLQHSSTFDFRRQCVRISLIAGKCMHNFIHVKEAKTVIWQFCVCLVICSKIYAYLTELQSLKNIKKWIWCPFSERKLLLSPLNVQNLIPIKEQNLL